MTTLAPIELLTPSDAARRAGVSNEHIKYEADRGEIPLAARTPGGNRLFTAEAIDAYIERRQQRRAASRA